MQHTSNEYMSYVTDNKSMKYMSLPNEFKCNLRDKKHEKYFKKLEEEK